MKFIIIDWMSNVSFESQDKHLDDFDACREYLYNCIFDNYSDCKDEYCVCEKCDPEGMNFDQNTGEYEVIEYDESLDRLMWSGTRYVLKKDYYKGI